MALELFGKKILDVASKAYKASVASELNKMGLRYEDLLNSSKPEVAEALELADPEYVKGRMRRLKRASDLTFKGKNLGDYSNEPLTPFRSELQGMIDKIQARDAEYALLDLHKK